MIQRIQTVYMLFSIVIISLMFFFPLAELYTNNGYMLIFNFKGIISDSVSDINNINTVPLIILMIIILVISVISIFTYKNRMKQMRFIIFNLLLIIGLAFLTWFYIAIFSKVASGTLNYKITAIFPLISIIFLYLAYKAILKDEKLVRSANRIR